jgi:hypothetical protein
LSCFFLQRFQSNLAFYSKLIPIKSGVLFLRWVCIILTWNFYMAHH